MGLMSGLEADTASLVDPNGAATLSVDPAGVALLPTGSFAMALPDSNTPLVSQQTGGEPVVDVAIGLSSAPLVSAPALVLATASAPAPALAPISATARASAAKSDRALAQAVEQESAKSVTQASTQAGGSILSEQQMQVALPKPGATWTSQQSTAAAQLRQEPSNLVLSQAIGQESVQTAIQVSTQTVTTMPIGQSTQVALPKPDATWASQQSTAAALLRQEPSNLALSQAIGKESVQTAIQASMQTVATMQSEQPMQVAAPKLGATWATQQINAAAILRQEPNHLATVDASSGGFVSANSDFTALLLSSQEMGIRPADRPTKHTSSRFGLEGEGVYGQPTATTNPADGAFQIAPTSATVASTEVAETVSYWASQGVHSASLQLEGFGDEPVEVRISVNGEMAQVDFRTNQPEVRQAIEGAASQLKDLLTGQGMQLAGFSIGTSGRGNSQDKDPKQAPETRKVTLLKSEVVETPRLRGANPSVGRSLDLFV
jgi:flagellar hook-length control protein FliK